MRALTAPLLLAAAVGVPYAATNAPDIENMFGGESKPATPSIASDNSFTKQGHGFGSASSHGNVAPVSGLPLRSMSLPEVIRFDVNKNWVFQRFQRKTTSLAELDLFGVRVPLVTGTALHDMAGSMTYYFDPQGLLQRITLVGSTGNTTQLEMLVIQRFGLQLQGTPIAGQRVYQQRQGDAVVSELVIRPSSVLRSDSPHESFQVDLRLQRPGSTTPLPARPLPVSEALSSRTNQNQVPTAEDVAQPSQPEQAQVAEKPPEVKAKASGEPFWRTYMPRSRVPEQQIENLDRHGRF